MVEDCSDISLRTLIITSHTLPSGAGTGREASGATPVAVTTAILGLLSSACVVSSFSSEVMADCRAANIPFLSFCCFSASNAYTGTGSGGHMQLKLHLHGGVCVTNRALHTVTWYCVSLASLLHLCTLAVLTSDYYALLATSRLCTVCFAWNTSSRSTHPSKT